MIAVTQETYDYVVGKRDTAQTNATWEDSQVTAHEQERDRQLGYVAQWDLIIAGIEVEEE